ncbi:hypothetical protein PENSPDRAFT_657488 [Peniophora sp. CONT]|nr:hypothetical protein PENSPDRAFT_657488 [Peniophora sp. CONT]
MVHCIALGHARLKTSNLHKYSASRQYNAPSTSHHGQQPGRLEASALWYEGSLVYLWSICIIVLAKIEELDAALFSLTCTTKVGLRTSER